MRDVDVERQAPKNDGTALEKKTTIKMADGHAVNHPLMKKIIPNTMKIISKTINTETPYWSFQYSHWDVTFLVVCVVAIAVDPLFFYLPVINEATKCIAIDNTLKIIAICVRSFLDLIAFGDLVARKISCYWPTGPLIASSDYCYSRSDYIINILSILPVHQVLMPIIFSEMSRSKIQNVGKFLNAIVLLQFLPRIFRIYRLWKIVNKTTIIQPKIRTNVKVSAGCCRNMRPPKGFIVMKAGFNLFLYLVASHALGAFWYFFSIEREITCWQLACEHDINGCSKSISLDCGTDGFGNYTFLNDFCSIEKPNTTLFDFGIFEDARQSGILASMDFPRKTMFCFWWGLRNLSSLGQNLQTSSYYWENCFTVLISIFGLLLFLYFIGTLQVYMEWEVSNESDEIMSKWSKLIPAKLQRIRRWIKTIGLPDELEDVIMSNVTQLLEYPNNDITENPFPYLPTTIRRLIMFHLCLPRLRRVPIFENESQKWLFKEITCKYLKQKQYNQNSFIVREGKPLNEIIFVVKGIVRNGDKTECLEKCDLIGERDLVEWVLKSPRQSKPPVSKRTLKCDTKVEVFYLMAGDLKKIISQFWWKFSKFRDITQFVDSKQLKRLAALSIQEAWRNHAIHSKQERT